MCTTVTIHLFISKYHLLSKGDKGSPSLQRSLRASGLPMNARCSLECSLHKPHSLDQVCT